MNILEHIRFNVCVKETVPVTKIYIFLSQNYYYILHRVYLHFLQTLSSCQETLNLNYLGIHSVVVATSTFGSSPALHWGTTAFCASSLGTHMVFHTTAMQTTPSCILHLHWMNLQSQTRSQIVPSDISPWMQDNQVQFMFGKNELLLFPANRSIHQIDINTDTLSYAR